MELTAQKAALYWGAKVISQNVYYGKEKFKIEGICENIMYLSGDWSGGTQPQYSCVGKLSIDECQLVLRTIKMITDEEIKKLAIFAVTPYLLPDEWELTVGKIDIIYIERTKEQIIVLISLFNDTLVIDVISCTISRINIYGDLILKIESAHRLTDYLRSIGIDIDNAISEGWAVLDSKPQITK